MYSKLTSNLEIEKFKQHLHATEPKTTQTIITGGPDSSELHWSPSRSE